MKIKNLKLLAILVTIILAISCFSTVSLADEETNDVTTISQDEVTNDENTSEEDEVDTTSTEESTNETELETVSGNYFKTGDVITVEQAIDGNAFIIADEVNITGQINGDLFVIAETLNIQENSAVYGNVFSLSKTFNMNGLAYNVYSATDEFNCGYNGMIALDFKVIAKNINFNGYAERSAYFVATDSLVLEDDAYICGNLSYNSKDSQTQISESATIVGTTSTSNFIMPIASASTTSTVLTYISNCIVALAVALVVLLIFLFIKPSGLESLKNLMFENPLTTLALGLLGFIIVPIICLILFMTSILSSVGLVLLGLYILILLISQPIAVVATAKLIDSKLNLFKTDFNIVIYTAITALIVWALELIPIFGLIVSIVLFLFGLGVISKKTVHIVKNREKIEPVKKEVSEDKENKKVKVKVEEAKDKEVKDKEVKNKEIKKDNEK